MRLSEEQLFLIQDMLDEFHLMAADVTQQLGACFLRNEETPSRYDGNHVRRIRLPAGVTLDEFFAEVHRFYSYQNYRAVRVDPWTRPLSIEARLLQEGYGHSTEIVLATDGPIDGRPADVEIATLNGEAGWAALRELIRHDEEYEGQGEQIFRLVRRRGDAFAWFLAMVDGKPVGHFSERTKEGIGYLEDLVVLPDFRLRGIATALVHRAAASARSKGAGLVFLPTDANDTPKDMYRRMGFEPVYAFRNYHKDLSDV